MRKVILTILVVIGLLLIFFQYGYQPLIDGLNLRPRAGLWVESEPNAEVLLSGKSLGQTPIKNTDLREGEYNLELKVASSSASWKQKVKLNGGTLTVVNRQLNEDTTQSSGEVITLEKGQGVRVTSVPGGAKVLIDGEEKGVTPLFVDNLNAGDHQFVLSRENYLKRNIKALVTVGYGLNLMVDLAQAEAETTPLSPPTITIAPKLKVLQTPVGFLRVRDDPSTSGKEIGRVSPGDELTLLEETNSDWDKVKTEDGKEGYVSSQYIEKE